MFASLWSECLIETEEGTGGLGFFLFLFLMPELQSTVGWPVLTEQNIKVRLCGGSCSSLGGKEQREEKQRKELRQDTVQGYFRIHP